VNPRHLCVVNPRPADIIIYENQSGSKNCGNIKMGSIQLLLEDPSYSAASDQKLSKDMGCIHLLLEDPIYSASWIQNCPKVQFLTLYIKYKTGGSGETLIIYTFC